MMATRVVVLALALFAFGAEALAQCKVPEDCVRPIYASYGKGGKRFDPNKLFDKEVLQLMNKAKSLDYDFFIQGQDDRLSRLKIARAEIKADKARVKIEFFNFDTRIRLDYYMVRAADGWRITEIKAARKSFRAYLKDGQ